jgi:hypothetical protein
MEAILQKLKKLQALADRAGSVAEAENALARIQEMLTKYNIAMAEVENYVPVEKDDIVIDRHNLDDYQSYHDGGFAYDLIATLAQFNFCRVIGHGVRINSKHRQGEFSIVGQRHNVDVVVYMYHYVLNNVKILAADAWKAYDRSGTKIKTVYCRHFFAGAVKAIGHRLAKQVVSCTDIILHNNKAIDAKVIDTWPKLRTAAPRRNYGSEMEFEGYLAGKKLDLNQALENETAKAKQLKS